MYASFFDKVKDWFNGVRNRETIKFNVIITIIGLILGFLFGITFGISEGFADNIGSLLGFTLIMTLVGGSFITFVANFFRRWWLIIQFGLDKQDIGWILGCIARTEGAHNDAFQVGGVYDVAYQIFADTRE